jgi:hypothetical protein
LIYNLFELVMINGADAGADDGDGDDVSHDDNDGAPNGVLVAG